MAKKKPKRKPAKPGRKPGRPKGAGAFRPTAAQRELVRSACALGIPEDRIARGIVNPATGEGITPVTLRKHFRTELDVGLLETDVEIGKNLLALTKVSAGAAIFAAKVRLHWRDGGRGGLPVPGHQDPALEAELEKRHPMDVARRIAWLLELGAQANESAST